MYYANPDTQEIVIASLISSSDDNKSRTRADEKCGVCLVENPAKILFALDYRINVIIYILRWIERIVCATVTYFISFTF